jgi:hypothetical protein
MPPGKEKVSQNRASEQLFGKTEVRRVLRNTKRKASELTETCIDRAAPRKVQWVHDGPSVGCIPPDGQQPTRVILHLEGGSIALDPRDELGGLQILLLRRTWDQAQASDLTGRGPVFARPLGQTLPPGCLDRSRSCFLDAQIC